MAACNSIAILFLLFATRTIQLRAADPPVIPVGVDAYTMWERWPYQRIGARAYMRSTYDRRGGNEGADAATSSTRWPTTSTSRSTWPGPGSSTSRATTTGTAAPGTTRSTARITSSRRPAPPTRASPSPKSVFLPAKLLSRARWPGPGPITKGADLIVGADPVRAVASAWPTRARATAPATTSTTSSCGARTSRSRSGVGRQDAARPRRAAT